MLVKESVQVSNLSFDTNTEILIQKNLLTINMNVNTSKWKTKQNNNNFKPIEKKSVQTI